MSFTTCSHLSTKDAKERRHVVLRKFHYRLQTALRKKVKATRNTNSNMFVYVGRRSKASVMLKFCTYQMNLFLLQLITLFIILFMHCSVTTWRLVND